MIEMTDDEIRRLIWAAFEAGTAAFEKALVVGISFDEFEGIEDTFWHGMCMGKLAKWAHDISMPGPSDHMKILGMTAAQARHRGHDDVATRFESIGAGIREREEKQMVEDGTAGPYIKGGHHDHSFQRICVLCGATAQEAAEQSRLRRKCGPAHGTKRAATE